MKCSCVDKSLPFCVFVMLFYFSVKKVRLEISLANLKLFFNVHPRRLCLDLIHCPCNLVFINFYQMYFKHHWFPYFYYKPELQEGNTRCPSIFRPIKISLMWNIAHAKPQKRSFQKKTPNLLLQHSCVRKFGFA